MTKWLQSDMPINIKTLYNSSEQHFDKSIR